MKRPFTTTIEMFITASTVNGDVAQCSSTTGCMLQDIGSCLLDLLNSCWWFRARGRAIGVAGGTRRSPPE